MTADRREFPNLHVLDHPLIQHKLSLMRDKRTPTSSSSCGGDRAARAMR
jgi:uracil phosphoribosyltransferase